MNKHTKTSILTILLCGLLLMSAPALAAEIKGLDRLIGKHDALLLATPEGAPLAARNSTQSLVPASIIKLLTALAAFDTLGPQYRFPTEFYIDAHNNLIIKGYGDLLLISEVLREIAVNLARVKNLPAQGVNDIVLDDTYFQKPVIIPGRSATDEPYDAPNGALCANFNTVFFKRGANGRLVSAEPQTPLLPFAENLIHKRKLKTGRIVLSHEDKENTIYAGKLFEFFLKKDGVLISGQVKSGKVNYSHDRLIFRYTSRFSLTETISKLLEHSNNFTTNQLLITAGIKAFGPPGNLKKGVEAARAYASRELAITDITIAEGSGISRQNKLSAREMMRALEAFEPNFVLLRQKGRDFYKTGTLHGINTRAGYITSRNGGRYRYVVMVNTNGKSTKPIMRQLLKILE